MVRKFAFFSAFVVPLTAFALTIQPGDFYDDVQVGSPEAAGINLLTREGVLEGYGDHLFGTNRLVNRAEFLKIAILSTPGERRPEAVTGGCFPDVPADVWFAPTVCAAKNAGIVRGNPDGLFHPERPVQYDEALKMLTILYGYEIDGESAKDWGEPYYNAAASRGTDLPIRITYATPLTRALSARLAAAFLAESEGQLTELRLAEHNEYSSASSSSSSVVSSMSSSSSSSAASSSSVSSSAPTALFTLPSVSHFLVTGEASDAIADGVVRSNGGAARISLAEVKLFSEARSVEHLEIVTSDGTVIAKLLRKITTDTTDYKLTFQANINPEDRFLIPADTDVPVILRAVIRSDSNAGFSEELLQVRTFSITLLGEPSNQSNNIPLIGPFPKHQTSFGRITGVQRISPPSAKLVAQKDLTIGSFSMTGTAISGKSLALSALNFSLYVAGQVSLSNVTVVNRATGAASVCSVNLQAKTIYCPELASTVGVFPAAGPLVIDLHADIAISDDATNVALEASLNLPGSPSEIGAIEWSDTSGMFRWIEHDDTPIASGTRFE